MNSLETGDHGWVGGNICLHAWGPRSIHEGSQKVFCVGGVCPLVQAGHNNHSNVCL